jgi:endonuclease III
VASKRRGTPAARARESRSRPALEEIAAALEELHGAPATLPTRDPFELVLWENAAYLVDDATRAAVFARLKERVGTSPREILRARPGALVEAIRAGGMFPERRAEKLVRAAELAVDLDLAEVLKRPLPEARRMLRRLPGIGEPGADKLLVMTGAAPLLALDSNGLRVLVRIGFGAEARSYAATYRSVQASVGDVAPLGARTLARLHLLLRRHGQTVCRRSRPLCAACPLRTRCAHGRGRNPRRQASTFRPP